MDVPVVGIPGTEELREYRQPPFSRSDDDEPYHKISALQSRQECCRDSGPFAILSALYSWKVHISRLATEVNRCPRTCNHNAHTKASSKFLEFSYFLPSFLINNQHSTEPLAYLRLQNVHQDLLCCPSGFLCSHRCSLLEPTFRCSRRSWRSWRPARPLSTKHHFTSAIRPDPFQVPAWKWLSKHQESKCSIDANCETPLIKVIWNSH